jgi:hypothetical protein
MKSSSKLIWQLIFRAALLILGPATVCGADMGSIPAPPAWVDQVPCNGKTNAVTQAFDFGKSVLLCLDYDPKKLRADPDKERREVPLLITSYTAKDGGIVDVTRIDLRSTAQRGLEFPLPPSYGKPPSCPAACSCRTFSFLINIVTREVRSDDYHAKFSVQLGKEIGYPEFDFAVAAPGDWLELDPHSGSAISCWTGSDCSNLRLKLINKLPWEVTILNIEANNQDGLVEDQSKFNPQQSSIPVDNVPHNVDVSVQAKSLSWSGVFAGFGKAPRVDLLVSYQASGHTFVKTVPVNLQIKPNFLILTTTVLLGVFFGTIIRIDLRRLEKSGLITRKQLIAFACTTITTGIFVSLVALLANLKLVAFEEERIYSSWDPRVLFLTGLIGTIGGIPLIYGLLKLPKVEPKPQESGPQEKPT